MPAEHTAVDRPIDLIYPTNRAIALPPAAMVLFVWALARQLVPGQRRVQPISQ